MLALDKLDAIVFPSDFYRQLIDHCRRKYHGDYHADELAERKAYGLIGGKRVEGKNQIEITDVFPLLRNMRNDERFGGYINEVMEDAGNASKEFPMQSRGWVADPREVLAAQRKCDAQKNLLFGNYHMHTIVGDRCTKADRVLAEGNGMWTFIISFVDPKRYIVRAYFESKNEIEIPILL